MKKLILLLIFFGFAVQSWGQVDIKNDSIFIKANSDMENFETQIEYQKNKCYKVIIENTFGKNVSIKKNATMLPILSTEPKVEREKNDTIIVENIKLENICFKRNTEYVFIITSTEDPKEKTYKIKTQTDWSWSTTFGANTIFFTNRNRFITHKTEDGSSAVTQIEDGKNMDLMPTIMFTFLNNHKSISPGFTGGLGVNFEEISVFTGLSLGIGQNIILTGGVGIHKQMRPNSEYYLGQTIDSSVTNENLNESQYRVNPFLGISFRLDKNPFGKKTE